MANGHLCLIGRRDSGTETILAKGCIRLRLKLRRMLNFATKSKIWAKLAKGEKCPVERDSLRSDPRVVQNPAWCKYSVSAEEADSKSSYAIFRE